MWFLSRKINRSIRLGVFFSCVMLTGISWVVLTEPMFAGFAYGSGTVRGRIQRMGEPISRIRVTLQSESGEQYEPVFSDADGMFIFNGVAPGRYTLFVSQGTPDETNPLKKVIMCIVNAGVTNVPPIELQPLTQPQIPQIAGKPSSSDSEHEISADEARQFVRDVFGMVSQNAPTEQLLKAYAEPVKYYNLGTINHDKLRQILERKRFPTSKYEVESIDVIKVTPREISQGIPTDAVRVRLSYHEKTVARTNEPTSLSETWVLRKANGNVQIVECQKTEEWQKKLR
jgi:hypothetical protein